MILRADGERTTPGARADWLLLLLLPGAVPAAAQAVDLDRRADCRPQPRRARRRGQAARDQVAPADRPRAPSAATASFSIDAQWGRSSSAPAASQRVHAAGPDAGQAYDGREALARVAVRGRRDAEKRRADDAARDAAHQADLDGPLVDWREKGHQRRVPRHRGRRRHRRRTSCASRRKDGDVEYVYPRSRHVPRDPHRRPCTRSAAPSEISETDLGDYEQVARRVDARSRSSPGGKGGPRTAHDHRRARRGQRRRSTTRCSGSRAGRDGRARDHRRRPPTRQRAAPPPPRADGAPPVFDAGIDLGPRRAQHRLGRDERPHRRGRRRATRAARRRSSSARPRAACGSRTDGGTTFKPVFDKQPVQSIGAITIDPIEPEDDLGRHRRSRGRATRSRSATASTSRPTAARPGPTWACRDSERIARILVHPQERQRRVRLRARQAVERLDRSRPLQDQPTAARPGRWCSRAANLSTGCSSVDDGSEEPRRAARRACGTSAARAGRSAPAATGPTRRAAAGCSARPTAARRGRR